MALGLEQALKIVVSAVDNASAVLEGIRGSVNTLTNDATTAAETLDTIGQGLQQTGRSMTRYVTAPVVGGLGLAAKEATEFEEKLAILGVAARDSGTDVETLGDAAIAMGQDIRLVAAIGPTDAIDAMTTLLKSGVSVVDMFGDLNAYMKEGAELGGILGASARLAGASELNLQQATEAVLQALRTYGLEVEDADAVVDNYVQTADASAASVEDLVAAQINAGPVMKAYNRTFEDTNRQFAILADRGIKGAEAGTNLRSMYNSMLRDTKRTNDALETLNMSLYDSEGALRAPLDIISDVNNAMLTLTDEEKLGALRDLFGTYGQLAGITLGQEGVAGWDAMGEKIAKAATAQEVAEARSGTFAKEIEKLQDSIQTFMITAGTPFIEDFLQPAVEHLQGFVDKLNELNPATLDWLLKISMIAAVVGPALIALGTLARSLASLITLYRLLAGAQAAAGIAGGAAGAAGLGAGAAGAGAGAAGLGAAGTALTGLPALGALGVIGAAAYATTHEEEVKEAEVNAMNWLRNLIGLPDYDPNRSPLEQLWWSKQGAAEDDEPAGPWKYIPSVTGEDLYFPEMPVEVPDIALAEEATTTAADWVGEFESAMAQYDSVFATIGVGGGDALKAGFMYAAEDAGSDFLITIARQLAPELVPYVMEAIAARAATEGPVG